MQIKVLRVRLATTSDDVKQERLLQFKNKSKNANI